MKYVLLIVFAVITLITCAGCESGAEAIARWESRINAIQSQVDNADTNIATLEGVISETSSTLDAYGDDPPEWIGDVQSTLDEAVTKLGTLSEHKATLQSSLAVAKQQLASIPENASATEVNLAMAGQAVGATSNFLPEPYKSTIAGIGALIGASGGILGLFGIKKGREAQENLTNTVETIENVKRVVPAFKAGFDTASPTINAAMPAKTREAVDKLRKKVGKVS